MTTYVDELRRVKGGGAPNSLYHFNASCPYLERELTEAIGAKFSSSSISVVNADLSETDVQEFKFLVSSSSLLTSGKLILVSGAEKLKGDAGKEIIQALSNANPQNIIIFTDHEISKTTSLGKFIGANATVIDNTGLNDKMLLSWVKKRFKDRNCEVADDAILLMLERTLGDMIALSQEIDKLSSYAGEGATLTKNDISQNLPENPEIIIFQITDALGAKQPAKGVRLLHEMVKGGEPPERIIVMIYNHFLRVLLAKEMTENKLKEKEVAEKLKCHPFAAKKAIESGQMFSKQELIGYLAEIQKADVATKTGLADALSAIETALFQLVKI